MTDDKGALLAAFEEADNVIASLEASALYEGRSSEADALHKAGRRWESFDGFSSPPTTAAPGSF